MKKDPEVRSLESRFIRAKEEGPERLLLVMHGLGDSLEGYSFLPKMLQLPGLSYLLVNAPDRYFTGYSWFDLHGQIEVGINRSRDLLFDVLGEIQEAGWDPQHIGVFGFSQGCLMALELACFYPKTLGAIVGVSGFMGGLERFPEGLSPVARSQRIFVTHGTQDSMLPLAQSRAQMHALAGMGLKLEFKVYEKEHTIDPRREVDDIRAFLQKTLFGEKNNGSK